MADHDTGFDPAVYRSDDEALRAQALQLQQEAASLDAQEAELHRQVEKERALVKRARRRLAEAGPGRGWADPVSDRVDLAALVLVLLGLLCALLHIPWHSYILTDSTVVPAICLLATPGALALLLALPHWRGCPRCRLAALLGLVVLLLPGLNLALALL